MTKKIFSLLVAGFIGFAAIGCEVDTEGEFEAPEVEVEPGEVPEVEDVRGPDVDVGTEEMEVEVPDVDVDLPEENPDDVDASEEY